MTTVNTINAVSTIQRFFNNGIDFLKIKSDTKDTRAAKIHSVKNKPLKLWSTLPSNPSSAKNPPATKQMAVMRFKGVSLSLNPSIF